MNEIETKNEEYISGDDLELESLDIEFESDREKEDGIPMTSETEQKLGAGRIILLASIVFLSFIVSFPFFIPYDMILRNVLTGFSRKARIQFDSMSPGIFSPDEIRGFRIILPDGSGIASNRITSDIGIAGLLSENLNGQVFIFYPKLNLAGSSLNMNLAQISADLRGIFQPPGAWSGNLSIRMNGIRIKNLPGIATSFLPELSAGSVKIKSLIIAGFFPKKGTFQFKDSALKSNLFNAKLSGLAHFKNDPGSPRLDVKLCITPDSKLKVKNQKLYDKYILIGGSAGGNLCISLKGKPSNLQHKIIGIKPPGEKSEKSVL